MAYNIQMNYYDGSSYQELYPAIDLYSSINNLNTTSVLENNNYIPIQITDDLQLQKISYENFKELLSEIIVTNSNSEYVFTRSSAPKINQGSKKSYTLYSSGTGSNPEIVIYYCSSSNLKIGMDGHFTMGSYETFSGRDGSSWSIPAQRYVATEDWSELYYLASSQSGEVVHKSNRNQISFNAAKVNITNSDLSQAYLTDNTNSYKDGVTGNYYYTRKGKIFEKIKMEIVKYIGTNSDNFTIEFSGTPSVIIITGMNISNISDFGTSIATIGSAFFTHIAGENLNDSAFVINGGTVYISTYNNNINGPVGLNNNNRIYYAIGLI